MEDSSAKDAFKEMMMHNQQLNELLNWKGEEGLIPSRANFDSAIEDGKPNVLKYFIAIGVKPAGSDLPLAVGVGHLDVVTVLIQEGVELTIWHLYWAIHKRRFKIAEYLVARKVQPQQFDLVFAIKKGYADTVQYFIEVGVPAEQWYLDLAKQHKPPNPNIIKHLQDDKRNQKFRFLRIFLNFQGLV